MTKKGVAAYRRKNPGSKLKTAVTGKVKPGSKAANRRKSYCARSAGQMKQFQLQKDPNSRIRQGTEKMEMLNENSNTRRLEARYEAQIAEADATIKNIPRKFCRYW